MSNKWPSGVSGVRILDRVISWYYWIEWAWWRRQTQFLGWGLWTRVSVNSRGWWWTGRPGVLRFMRSQRVGHDWATELNWFHGMTWTALRVPWTARRSNQSIPQEINPEYSLEGLMLKLKLQYSGHLMLRANSLEKTQARKNWRQEKWATEDEVVG